MKMSKDEFIDILKMHGTRYAIKNDVINVFDGILYNISKNGIEKWTSLPDNIIFHSIIDLHNTSFTSIPKSIIFKQSCFFHKTQISNLPVLNVGHNLVTDIDEMLKFGTYVGNILVCSSPSFAHLHRIKICGHIVNNGIIS